MFAVIGLEDTLFYRKDVPQIQRCCLLLGGPNDPLTVLRTLCVSHFSLFMSSDPDLVRYDSKIDKNGDFFAFQHGYVLILKIEGLVGKGGMPPAIAYEIKGFIADDDGGEPDFTSTIILYQSH